MTTCSFLRPKNRLKKTVSAGAAFFDPKKTGEQKARLAHASPPEALGGKAWLPVPHRLPAVVDGHPARQRPLDAHSRPNVRAMEKQGKCAVLTGALLFFGGWGLNMFVFGVGLKVNLFWDRV